MTIPLLLHGKHGPTVTYQPFGPWMVPWRFESLETEYRALRTGVGLIDYSTQALIEVRGADRVGFLHHLLTNDIKGLISGRGCQAALLDASAKLIATMTVLADSDALWLLCDLQHAEVLMKTLDHYRFSEQVSLTNHERRYAVLALQGPRALEVLTRWLGPASLPASGDHVIVTQQDISIRLIRQSLTGTVGLLCLVPGEDAKAVWDVLTQHGSSWNLRLIGWEALNVARIEAGMPWPGIDMDEHNLLPEIGLDRLMVSDTKGCYVGQEIIARLQTYGSMNKKLMGLLIEGEPVPEAGDQIARDGDQVGWVTSGCWSLALQQPIAMGYLKRGAYEVRTAVEIMRGHTPVRATVVERPFVAAAA